MGLAVGSETGLKNKLFSTVDQCCVERPAANCYNKKRCTRLYASVAPLKTKFYQLDCLLQNIQLYLRVAGGSGTTVDGLLIGC